MEELVRKSVLKVDPYVAGKPIEETKRQLGLKEVIKLASNENPLGPSPRAVSAISKALKEINRYPDSQSFYLKKKLARHYSLETDNFVIGNGSDELIDIIIKTFLEPGENIVTSDCTFLEYGIMAQVNERMIKKVPLRYFKYDLEAVLRAVDKKTKLVFIANPNNPTGTYVTREEVADFLEALDDSVTVVFDEAYDSFIDVNDYPDSIGLLRKKKRVIVLKTFSKAYGLAGLRLGYAVSDKNTVSYLERMRQPFNVNMLAQAAGVAALDDRDFLKKSRRAVLEGKKFIYKELSGMGLGFTPSVANFILIDTGRDCLEVFKSMLKFGVIVRDMKQYNLKNFIRVTVGTQTENKRFVRVLKKVLKEKNR
ncbi:MAG: histidinol-phosphate transaminase [Candidatus Omnitrophica bacterium]|nr:histidinol-phosphate transaminase [Candidatus Omnitrophota bacterium]